MRPLVRTVGTAGVVLLLLLPLLVPDLDAGVLGEVAAFPAPVAVAVVVVFFGLVALYCRALGRVLAAVGPAVRTATPASVWWMFAIPYNFVEDFFIVRAVGASMAADGRLPAGSVRRWSALGLAWCSLQILSLLPGDVGRLSGAGALVVWAGHWAATVRAQRLLAAPTVPAAAR